LNVTAVAVWVPLSVIVVVSGEPTIGAKMAVLFAAQATPAVPSTVVFQSVSDQLAGPPSIGAVSGSTSKNRS